MPVQRLSTTMLSFLALFSGGAMLVLFWVTLESLFIKRLTFSYLLRFSLPATLILLLGMVGILMLYVWLRLMVLLPSRLQESNREDRICRSLLRLPSELFWGTVAYGALFIPIYHIVHFLVEGHSLVRVEEHYWLNFLRSLLYEQTIALSAAILHYAVARRLIRPMLIRLKNVNGGLWPDKSFLSMLATTFAGLLLVNLFSILWYVMVAIVKEESIELEVLGPLVVLNLLFATSIFALLAVEFHRELHVLIGSIRNWLNGDHGLYSSRMPILSHDEVGQLAFSFNRLQDHVHQEYEDLKKDLQLASLVRLQLLPAPRQFFGDYEVQVLSESRQTIGNGFYDVIPRKHNGFAAMVGGIKGAGMPAALQMSAALLLLRAEIEQESMPEHILTRFNRGLNEVFPKEAPIDVSLILVDTHRDILRVALQGGIKLGRVNGGGLELPSADSEIPFHAGDQWLLYSESAKEAALAIALESVNGLGPPQGPLSERVGAWTTRFVNGLSAKDEDFTLLLITSHGRRE